MSGPGLVVFDLDFTLWNCGGLWVDCTDYPFHRASDGLVRDSSGREFRFYEDVIAILEALKERNLLIGLASRTERPAWACNLLELLGVRDRFHFEQIFPGSKRTHFERLRADSGVDYDEMLFFDDESRNVLEISQLGVTCVHVRNGLSREVFDRAMSSFS